MDCIEMLTQAINYMEEHLLDSINYEDVAKYLNVSNFHFHRIFSMFTGYTANEYIRLRRLSMAGQELILSDAKIIDIAYKYGYDTPESFTRAFTRFHGVSPIVAKRSGYPLKSFNRLIIKIKFEGGTVLDYRIVKKDAFTVLVKARSFANDIISDKNNHEVADFWGECGNMGVFDILNQYSTTYDTYGVCGPISKESDFFSYGIGKPYNGNKIPEGFELWTVRPTLWAVFQCFGTEGDCISAMWDRIHTEFLPSSGYTMLDDYDYELYPADSGELFCEIWIPIVKKNEKSACDS